MNDGAHFIDAIRVMRKNIARYSLAPEAMDIPLLNKIRIRRPPEPEGRPFRILALSGGGALGYFSACVLAKMENELGPLGEAFDLVIGTSAGGILALTLSRRTPMSQVLKVFEEYAPQVFSDPTRDLPYVLRQVQRVSKFANSLNKSLLETELLKQAITEMVGEGTRMAEAIHPVMVTAYDATEGRPKIFSAPFSERTSDLNMHMVDAALATSAAPALFPLHEARGHVYVDGGLWACAPDLVAIRKAVTWLGVPMGKIRMVSVGTMTGSFVMPQNVRRDLGLIGWAADDRLPSITVAAQQQETVEFARELLGPNDYLRIDSPRPAGGKLSVTSGDEASLKLMRMAASAAWEKAKDHSLVKPVS